MKSHVGKSATFFFGERIYKNDLCGTDGYYGYSVGNLARGNKFRNCEPNPCDLGRKGWMRTVPTKQSY